MHQCYIHQLLILEQRLSQRQYSNMNDSSKRKSLSKLLDAVVAKSRLVSAVLIAVGVLGLFAVPLLERKISFDENALLAGSATPTIRTETPDAYRLGKQFAASLVDSYFSPTFTQQLQQQITQQLGLQVSNHTYTTSKYSTSSGSVSSSINSSWVGLQQLRCSNVHTVLESRRGDGKEALVLVTPINHQQFATDFEQDASGVQLALSLGFAMLYHLKSSAPWLAKDVIWVIPDASCGLVESMQAWTDAYQHPASLAVADNRLEHFSRAGVLQQALVFELPTGSFNQLQVSLEGYDGLLPKLDMFWLFRWYSWHYVAAPVELPHLGHIQQALAPITAKLLAFIFPNGGSDSAAGRAIQQHLFKFSTMSQFMWRQARGLAMGAHAPFKGLMVDAATLRVLKKDTDGYVVGPAGFAGVGNLRRLPEKGTTQDLNVEFDKILTFDAGMMQLGDVLELTLRSCSVLIERFHHSLFLYVLTGLDHYVSVERYIGPLVALIIVLVVQAAAIKQGPGTPVPQSLNAGAQPQEQQAADNTTSEDRDDTPGLEDPLQLDPPEEAAAAERLQWISAIKLVASAHVLAVAAACALRQAPVLLPLLLEPQVLSGWLTAAATAPGEHVEQLGLGFGLILALLMACEGVSSGVLASCRSKPTDVPNAKLSSSTVFGALRSNVVDGAEQLDFIRRMLVVEFSVAAAALAAVACLNWALGYVACLVLVPLAVGCTSSSSSWKGKLRPWVVLLWCSPPYLLLILAMISDGGLQSVLQWQWLQWLVVESSRGAYMLCWGVYVPFWCFLAWSVVTAR